MTFLPSEVAYIIPADAGIRLHMGRPAPGTGPGVAWAGCDEMRESRLIEIFLIMVLVYYIQLQP
jgi:hypothetical protein